ncbi:putative caffeoylshikimate esterase [Iris pallida]|uniref:Caffeoylshikimate esterase n=1 Tax=Iris pallida TaxID=29817 RepID=A0AAX6EF22_IRIPA|nr:putative caffeoylshikimate esterase [Iris pallida]
MEVDNYSSEEFLRALSKSKELDESYYLSQGVRSSQSYYAPPGPGLPLFTRSWVPPPDVAPKALVFMVHGYGNDISWTFQATPIFLASRGFACFALDLPGHGRSHGLRAFVPDLAAVVRDCVSFFTSVRAQYQSQPPIKSFLFGESMGGAICLLIHLLDKSSAAWDGAVLVAPMCKISDGIRPPWPLPQLLTLAARFLPTLPVVPTADLLDKSVRVPEKRAVAAANPARYRGKPRLGTVMELLRVTDDLAARLGEVALPFLVLHGSADAVTDPEVSRELHRAARSEDKTIRIYPGMMHSLLFGETDENVATVRRDILAWLEERCSDK